MKLAPNFRQEPLAPKAMLQAQAAAERDRAIRLDKEALDLLKDVEGLLLQAVDSRRRASQFDAAAGMLPPDSADEASE